MPFGHNLEAFWMPLGVRDVPGLHFSEFVNVNDFGNVSATKG